MVKCNAVILKFKDRNEPRQEISAAHVSGATKLAVSRDTHYITIDCLTKEGVSIKQINFNVSDIKEYTCEGVFMEVFVPMISRQDTWIGGK